MIDLISLPNYLNYYKEGALWCLLTEQTFFLSSFPQQEIVVL